MIFLNKGLQGKEGKQGEVGPIGPAGENGNINILLKSFLVSHIFN